MPRTTPSLVQGILLINWDGKTQLDPFIAGASMVVDQAVPFMRKRRFKYTATQLELLERYLAAHFYCKADPLYTSKSDMGASGSYQRQGETGFQLTEYGRAACEMDVSGVLSAIGKRQVAGVFWVGIPCSPLVNRRCVGTGSVDSDGDEDGD